MAEPDAVARQDGKVFSVEQVVLDLEYLNPKYVAVSAGRGAEISRTGWLKVFDIVPKVAGLPVFSGRWQQNPPAVDIDICNVSDEQARDFKREVGGYRGHHTSPGQSTEGLRFRTQLRVPDGEFGDLSDSKICEGSVLLFALLRKYEWSLAVKGVAMMAEAEVVRPTRRARVWARIKRFANVLRPGA